MTAALPVSFWNNILQSLKSDDFVTVKTLAIEVD